MALLGADVPELFIYCVEQLDNVLTTRNPEREFALLCTKLSLQKVRLVVWGEALGLLPDFDGASPCNNKQEHWIEIKPALEENLTDLYRTIAGADVFIEWFYLTSDASPREQDVRRVAAESVHLPVFNEMFERYKERLQRQRWKGGSSWVVRRWSVYDLEKFTILIDKIKGVLDTLEGITACLGILGEQQSLLRHAIESSTDEASLVLLDHVSCPQESSPVLSVVPSAVGHALKAVAGPRGREPHSARRPRLGIASSVEKGLSGSQEKDLPAVPGVTMGSSGQGGHHREADIAGQADLCGACRVITLPVLVNGFRHTLDFDQVQKSKDYCRFCALMLDAYGTQTCIDRKNLPCDKIHRGRLQWALQKSGPGVRYESSLFQCGIFTQRDLQASCSPRNIRLLRSWLDECRLHHHECRRGRYSVDEYDDVSSSATLPSRVIDVGASDGSEAPRLVTTSSHMTGRHLALSHCWGKTTPTKTTKGTLAAWHAALPQRQLSKTFQDAIFLTRELNERFLWIDSLCIVQDDPNDLETQIGLMGTIFEQSYCIIVAVDAKGADGAFPDRGLFLSGGNAQMPRLWVRHHPSLAADSSPTNPYDTEAVQFAERTPAKDEMQPVFMDPLPNQSDLFTLQFEQKSWYSRGWVYQEKQLSRRCIFYTEEKVAWKCNRYWETEQTGVPERRMSASESNLETRTVDGITYGVHYAARKLWETSVEEYSCKQLTYVADKGKAIKGFEERIAARCGATFRFGLLDFGPKDVLLSQLLWVPTVARSRSWRGDPSFPCPSWSWMAVNGPARWTANEYLTHPEALSEVSFGEVTADGRQVLRISGPCRDIKVGPVIDHIPRFTQFERWPPEIHFGWTELGLDSGTNTVLSAASGEILGWVSLDTSEEPSEIVAFPLLQYLRLDDETESMCVDFVALAKTPVSMGLPAHNGGGEIYYRVGRGRVHISSFAWLEGCRKHDVVVV